MRLLAMPCLEAPIHAPAGPAARAGPARPSLSRIRLRRWPSAATGAEAAHPIDIGVAALYAKVLEAHAGAQCAVPMLRTRLDRAGARCDCAFSGAS